MFEKKMIRNVRGYHQWLTTGMMVRFLVATVLICIDIMLACSLLSSNSTDESWFFVATEHVCHNMLGSWGAYVASLIYFFMGSAGYILIPLVGVLAFKLLTKKIADYDVWLGYTLVVCSYAGLLAGYRYDSISLITPGGFLGQKMYSLLVPLFDEFLAIVFLFVLLGIGLLLIADYVWIACAQWLMAGLSFIANKEKFLKPAWRICSFCCMTFYTYGCLLCKKVWHLLNGVHVHNDEQSILSFEDIVDREWLAKQEDDNFWDTLFNKQEGIEQEATKPTSLIEQEEAWQSISEVVFEPSAKTVEADLPIAAKAAPFCLPPVHLFETVDTKFSYQEKAKLLQQQATALEEKLECFGIKGKVSAIKVGPVITLFEYEPHIESKISKIIALEDDLALALQALSIRIIAPIPGRSVIGFEVANKQRTDVWLANALHTPEFKESKAYLPLILGQDIVGDPAVIDLAVAPHLLVAGSTGSGKSSALNGMLISLLFKYAPDQLKLVLIDPKRLEFAVYGQLPHLLFPIVTDPRRAVLTLKWIVKEMEHRYTVMEQMSVRNIIDYQAIAKKDSNLEQLPFIVVMIDELSDLIMTAGKEIEDLIVRIAQMARAAGIHLIVATQRPSVDVITGLIKANFPSRISFRVTSKIDSRTILDCSGAEKLLGKGDMLYLDAASHLKRIHGAYVTMGQIEQLISFIGAQQDPCFIDIDEQMLASNQDLDQADEQLFQEIIPFLQTVETVSISSLQRRFRIGYNRSARIIEQLEAQGLIMQDPIAKVRKVVR